VRAAIVSVAVAVSDNGICANACACADRSAWLMVSVLAQDIERYVAHGTVFVCPNTSALSLACFLAMGNTDSLAPANAHLRPGATPNDNSVKAGRHFDIVSHAERCDIRVCDGTCRSLT
jgi:hypothetical protein